MILEHALWVRLHGVFGRNRKVKSESFKLFQAAAIPQPDEIDALLQSFLREKKAQLGTKYSIVCYPVEIEKMDGVIFESTRVSYGSKPIVTGVV